MKSYYGQRLRVIQKVRQCINGRNIWCHVGPETWKGDSRFSKQLQKSRLQYRRTSISAIDKNHLRQTTASKWGLRRCKTNLFLVLDQIWYSRNLSDYHPGWSVKLPNCGVLHTSTQNICIRRSGSENILRIWYYEGFQCETKGPCWAPWVLWEEYQWLMELVIKHDGLTEESKYLDIQFSNGDSEEDSSQSFTELESVLEFTNLEDNQGKSGWNTYPTGRFCSTQSILNMLALKTIITRTQADEGVEDVEKEIIDANGTWQSILRWGQNERLDEDQKTAFEILAATYILSFSDEAAIDGMSAETSNVIFDERVKGLHQLARGKEDTERPLCMFITGPAGAGKSKSILWKSHSKTKITI
jgi:hypothetical protein